MFKSTIKKSKFVKAVSICVLLSYINLTFFSALWATPESKIGPAEFDNFLNSCEAEEYIQLGLALQLLTNEEIGEKNNWPSLLIKVSPSQIKKELVRLSYHSLNFWQSEKDVDYHEIVEWVARKIGVNSAQNSSTRSLEEQITSDIIGKIWDQMNAQQRKDLLIQIQGQCGKSIDIDKYLEMGGSMLIRTLIVAKFFYGGFAFFSMAMTFLSAAAGVLGIALPFVAYTSFATVIGFLTGPIGWILSLSLTALALGSPDANIVARFVIAAYMVRQLQDIFKSIFGSKMINYTYSEKVAFLNIFPKIDLAQHFFQKYADPFVRFI